MFRRVQKAGPDRVKQPCKALGWDGVSPSSSGWQLLGVVDSDTGPLESNSASSPSPSWWSGVRMKVPSL